MKISDFISLKRLILRRSRSIDLLVSTILFLIIVYSSYLRFSKFVENVNVMNRLANTKLITEKNEIPVGLLPITTYY